MDQRKYLDKAVEALKAQTPLLDHRQLRIFVARFLKDRQVYLDAHGQHGSPLYLIDQEALTDRADEFRSSFVKAIPKARFFYALKSNDHPVIVRTLVEKGYGVDVSSGKELSAALLHNPASIIFSGPGKTAAELELACRHAGRVTVLIDSFAELERLETAASRANVRVKSGVRLMIEENGLWRKFGIPLARMSEFFNLAGRCAHVDLCGLQFHASWNLDAGKQEAFLARLGPALSHLDKEACARISFIDIGGGYWPAQGEWLQPGATAEGRLKQCLEPRLIEGMDHRHLPSLPIGQFAGRISAALTKHIFPAVDCDIYLEPGRWICHDAMHILLRVADKKDGDVVITDGGTNIVGWERYENDYFPVINISRPSLVEKPCMVFGSLCTPHDIWGYSYFGEDIQEGDILLIPAQGAYTYSLRQPFIKPPAKDVVLAGHPAAV